MDKEIKLAKYDLQKAQLDAAKDLAIAVLDNPIVEYGLGLVLISAVQRYRSESQTWLGRELDNLLSQGILSSIVIAKAISPAMNTTAGAAVLGKFLK